MCKCDWPINNGLILKNSDFIDNGLMFMMNVNDKAIKLYESEGFKKAGTLRDNIKTDNGYRFQRIYSMIEDEYKVCKDVQK